MRHNIICYVALHYLLCGITLLVMRHNIYMERGHIDKITFFLFMCYTQM